MSTSVAANHGNITKSSEGSSSVGFTGIAFLVVVIYGIFVCIMMVIVIKRIVRRRTLTIRFVHKQNQPGAGGAEKLRVKINQCLDEVAQFMCEPVLLHPNDVEPTEESHLSDFYRMKTVDGMANVDKAFADFSSDLKRPMGKDVCQHLHDVKSHSSGCLKPIRTNQLHAVGELYTHARHGQEPFTLQDFNRFEKLTNNILSVLRQRKFACNSLETTRKDKESSSNTKGYKSKSASPKNEAKVFYNVTESLAAETVKFQFDTDPLLKP